MEIVFVSSLDASEEDRIASVLLATVSALLEDSPIAYTLRIRTSSLRLYQQSHVGTAPAEQSVVSAAKLTAATARSSPRTG